MTEDHIKQTEQEEQLFNSDVDEEITTGKGEETGKIQGTQKGEKIQRREKSKERKFFPPTQWLVLPRYQNVLEII